MGHLVDVADDVVSADVLSHGEGQGGLVALELLGVQHLLDGHGQRMVLERCVDALVEVAEYLQERPTLAACVDDIPRSDGAVRVFQIAVKGLETFVIMRILPEVFLVHAPCGILAVQELLQTPFLFLPADMEEELHHEIAVVRELAFYRLDAFHAALVGLGGNLPVQNLVHQRFHPEGVEELELPCLRNLDKVAIEEGVALFLQGRCRIERGHGEKAWVDVLDDLPDDAALAGRTPSLKDDHDGEFRRLDFHLAVCELFLFHADLFTQDILLRFFRCHKILQHLIRRPLCYSYLSLCNILSYLGNKFLLIPTYFYPCRTMPFAVKF